MKKSIMPALALLLALLMAACGGAENAQDETEENIETPVTADGESSSYLKRPLTSADIEHYLKAIDGFREKGQQIDSDGGGLQNLARALTIDGEVKEIIEKAGFANIEEFGMVSAKIYQVLMAIQMDNSGDEMKKAREEMLREFDEQMKNPDLDPAIKQMLEQQKDAALATLSQVSEGVEKLNEGITPAEVELVRGFLDRLEKAHNR